MIPNSQEIAADWSLRVEAALGRYDGELLDGVATRLLKPRGTLPREEVLDRTIEFFSNPVQVDRRISALDPAAQILLEVAAKSQKTVWFVGNLVEIVLGLGWKDGIGAVVGLLESGLAYPVFQLPTTPSPANEFQEMTTAAPLSQPVQFGNFLHWLSSPGPMGHNLFFVPGVLERMEGKPPLLPDLSKNPHARAPGRDEEDGQQADESEPFEEVIYGAPPFPGVEADGCEWFIRISLLWQKIQKNPLKMTQAGEFFNRDGHGILHDGGPRRCLSGQRGTRPGREGRRPEGVVQDGLRTRRRTCLRGYRASSGSVSRSSCVSDAAASDRGGQKATSRSTAAASDMAAGTRKSCL